LSSLAPGSTLCDGRYRLESVLGRGGMAIVWRASDLQLERDVAIKVISDVLATDPRFVARFEREARLAAGLSHANLVKVFDFSVDSERPFLIMEYVPGGTLAEARGRDLDAEVLGRDLLEAVAHIHAAGILHRDIKPANVLLGADGSPRLTDFGIARGDETTGLTQTGQVLGTLRYIAPEAAAGEPATVQSDLYSLGVLLSEVAGPNAREPLRSLLARMTAQDPADRPRSARDALAALDPTEATAPLRGQSPHGRVTYARAWRVRRSHALAAAAVLVALLVLVAVAASGGGGGRRAGSSQAANVVRPAPAGAPVGRQLDRLEQIVRAAPRKR
jgi:eukaryotic-like serine/threonine-protein kinase